MRNCPEEFYDNCKHAVYKCSKCRAGFGSIKSNLFYTPISKLLPTHPAESLSTYNNKAIRLGLKQEADTVHSWITQTLKSGSILGDGDIKVGDLKLDVKTRTNTKSFTVKTDEYNTGLKKGYDGWVIVNKDKERLVCLTEDAFLKLSGKLLEEISNL